MYKKDDIVKFTNGRIGRLTTDRLENGHYGATLDIYGTWPIHVIGAAIYPHEDDIVEKVNDDGQNTG